MRWNLFPIQGERIELTLWGSPTWKRYRLMFRELAVYASAAFVRVAHGHHGFSETDDPVGFRCAELIEAATELGARSRAVGWFVAHGRDGLMPPRVLGQQLGVDRDDFAELYEARIGRAAIEAELDESRGRAFPDGLVITMGDIVYEGREQGDAVVAWACGTRRAAAERSGRAQRTAALAN